MTRMVRKTGSSNILCKYMRCSCKVSGSRGLISKGFVDFWSLSLYRKLEGYNCQAEMKMVDQSSNNWWADEPEGQEGVNNTDSGGIPLGQIGETSGVQGSNNVSNGGLRVRLNWEIKSFQDWRCRNIIWPGCILIRGHYLWIKKWRWGISGLQ